MKIVDLFTDLAKKAGITDLTDPKYKDFLASSLEIDDDAAKKIQSSLFNEDAAKANEKIKNHFYAVLMNGVDTELDRLLDDEDFTDEDKNSIKAVNSSTKRMVSTYQKKVEKLNARLEEIKKGKGEKEKPGEADKLREDINSLNKKLGENKIEYESKLKAEQDKHVSAMNEKELDFLLSAYNYAFPKEMKLPAKIAAVKAVIMPEINSKGLKLVSNNGTLELLKSDGTKYFNEANQETSLTQYIDKVLADNKLLAVSDPNAGNGNGSDPPPTGGQDGKVDNALLESVRQDQRNAGITTG